MKREYYKILNRISGQTYQIPIFLDEKIDNMGVMSAFDGEMEQVEQFTNFSFTGDSYTLTIINTTNTNKLKTLANVTYTIKWGDGATSGLTMPTVYDELLPTSTHTYDSGLSDVTVEITVDTPWKVNNIKRNIKFPLINSYGWPDNTSSGWTLTYYVPSYTLTGTTAITQDYLQDYTLLTGDTSVTTISFVAVGKSRLNEFKVYGNANGFISGFIITTGVTDIGIFTGYSIDGLSYFDYENGYTHITGKTSGTTEYPYVNETLYNGMITRNEMLIGFIDEPQIYSDIFVERGKQSIIERNLRLGEINNMGELEIYGGGYFKVKKQ